MRNLKRLLFIVKIFMICVLAISIPLTLLLINPILFFIAIIILFLISLWFVSNDFVE